jgi:hypothetical protein
LSGITTGTATNLAGGSNGTIPYQSASGTTQMLAVGTSGQVLVSAGASAPTWGTVSSGVLGTNLSNVDYSLTTSTALAGAAGSGVFMQAVSLDGTSELMILSSDSSAHAVVYNTSTSTFGTPALVRTANLSSTQYVAIAKISSTAVLVCTNISGGTEVETVVLTVSGSTITVGTPVNTSLSASSDFIQPNTRLVAVGSSFVLNYFNASGTTPKFRAITVSGTTPTVGSELALTGAGTNNGMHHSYAYNSSTLLSFSMTNTSTVYAYPISVSGTTLTAGTAATAVTNQSSFATAALSTGRFLLVRSQSSGVYTALVSVAGTTATITDAAQLLTLTTWAPQTQVFGNKAFITSGNGTDEIAIATDTAGAITVSTPINLGVNGAFIGFLSTEKMIRATNSTGSSANYVIGNSSGTAVAEKFFQDVGNSTTAAALYTFLRYRQPLSGPSQSANGHPIGLRTTGGLLTPIENNGRPVSYSVDGVNLPNLQQNTNSYVGFNDAISTAVGWGLPQSLGNTTTVQLRRVTLA